MTSKSKLLLRPKYRSKSRLEKRLREPVVLRKVQESWSSGGREDSEESDSELSELEHDMFERLEA